MNDLFSSLEKTPWHIVFAVFAAGCALINEIFDEKEIQIIKTNLKKWSQTDDLDYLDRTTAYLLGFFEVFLGENFWSRKRILRLALLLIFIFALCGVILHPFIANAFFENSIFQFLFKDPLIVGGAIFFYILSGVFSVNKSIYFLELTKSKPFLNQISVALLDILISTVFYLAVFYLMFFLMELIQGFSFEDALYGAADYIETTTPMLLESAYNLSVLSTFFYSFYFFNIVFLLFPLAYMFYRSNTIFKKVILWFSSRRSPIAFLGAMVGLISVILSLLIELIK